MAIGSDSTAAFAALTAIVGLSLVILGWAISPTLSILRHRRRPLGPERVNVSVVVWALVAGGFGLTAFGLRITASPFDWLALPLAIGGILVGGASALEIHLRKWRWRREDLKREVKVMPDVSRPNLS